VYRIVQWLEARCFPDPVFPDSIISSIYYDTPSLHFLREKINSDFFKTKIRLRWYADSETEKPEVKSYLEAKYKMGSRREKIRKETHISGDWLSKVNLNDQALKNVPLMFLSYNKALPRPIFPVFDVNYRRIRFVEPTSGARLCIDYDICSSRVNWQILPKVPPIRLQTAVFELKGKSKDLPRALYPLTAMGCRKYSFSKYSVCYKKIIREMY
jgi:SPX domain protein involved in polyphosphate accumulation